MFSWYIFTYIVLFSIHITQASWEKCEFGEMLVTYLIAKHIDHYKQQHLNIRVLDLLFLRDPDVCDSTRLHNDIWLVELAR